MNENKNNNPAVGGVSLIMMQITPGNRPVRINTSGSSNLYSLQTSPSPRKALSSYARVLPEDQVSHK